MMSDPPNLRFFIWREFTYTDNKRLCDPNSLRGIIGHRVFCNQAVIVWDVHRRPFGFASLPLDRFALLP